MNWRNIDLNSNYEKDQNFLDGYDFSTLLLEVECNLTEITRETILSHVKKEIEIRVKSANDILLSNIDNIVKYANKERMKP